MTDPARRALLASLPAWTLGCAGPRFQPPPAPPPASPVVRIGDRWRYDEIDRYSGRTLARIESTVRAVTPQLVVETVDSQGVRRDDERYTGPWRVLQEPAYDATQYFDRPVPLIPAWLDAGTSERTDAVYRSAAGGDGLAWKDWLDALGWQRLVVPAGEFDCLVIRRRIWFRHPDVFRTRSERTETLWYAPAVNRWARRDWTGEYRSGSLRTIDREPSISWRLTGYTPSA